ncbi:glycine zipper 2TM domain-containing protein [Brevundimonas variabilis]|uniref:17 kDa surface antigen n=1 Tax=Brevundimonas variabilis TaxID=74312 RepID=A0A7W9FFH6_9CAUL|nr:glycine zipper 2TM domain-containing protein [Brevundimonas variabilis]MBB5745424.1 outer membrane lipoprotein SlyB [Brevundimonas variabilis]
MTARSAKKATLAIVAAVASAGALMVPASASAQSYGYVPGYGSQSYGSQSYGYRDNYDRCGQLGQGRTAAGATVGATLGAVAGSQLAARGRRTEGSILGGVVGALIGGSVGRASNDDCRTSGYDYRYDQSGYRDAPVYSTGYQQPVYDDRYRDERYQDDRYRDDRRYDDRQYGYPSSGYGYSQGYEQTCRTVQTTRRDPYGRVITQTRQVC